MTRADAIVLALAAALLGGLYAHYWRAGPPARIAEIRRGGELVQRVSLDHEARIRVAGPRGTSVLETRAGAIRFLSSPCPQQFCVHSGWLHRGGEATACLPNHLSVQVLGGGQAFDAMVF